MNKKRKQAYRYVSEFLNGSWPNAKSGSMPRVVLRINLSKCYACKIHPVLYKAIIFRTVMIVTRTYYKKGSNVKKK